MKIIGIACANLGIVFATAGYAAADDAKAKQFAGKTMVQWVLSLE